MGQMWIFGLLLVIFTYPVHSQVINAKFNISYTEQVMDGVVYQYEYHYQKQNVGSVVRVKTSVTTDESSSRYPIQVTTYQQLVVLAWNLPREVANGVVPFPTANRTLCSAGQDVGTTLPVRVVVSTFSPSPLTFHMDAELIDITVSHNISYNTSITPSSPMYYLYTFEGSRDETVLIHVNSPDEHVCAMISIQDADCPVEDIRVNDVAKGVVYQTFLKQAAIILDKSVLPSSSSIFIVFSILPFSMACTREYSPVSVSDVKRLTFQVEDDEKDINYGTVTGSTTVYCLSFVVLFGLFQLAICLKGYRNKKNGRMRNEPITGINEPTTGIILDLDEQNDRAEEGRAETPLIQGDQTINSDSDVIFTRDDHSKRADKSAYRFMDPLTIDNMAKKPDLHRKYMLYVWNTIIVAIFYGIPVVQLVVSYQYFVNEFGDQDKCYFNFLCARKYGIFHSFNNFISNIGYLAFGFSFIIIVGVRHARYNKLSDKEKGYGIPQFFGIYYSMGIALMIEGVMSGFYHFCPRRNNFQFDTAFMFILGTLTLLKLYQSRHPDINARAVVAYLFLAVLTAIVAIGVVTNSIAVWVVFILVHALSMGYISLKFYYVGSFEIFTQKKGRSIFHDKLKTHCLTRGCVCVTPSHPIRIMLIVFIIVVNIIICAVGFTKERDSFATYILFLIIGNMILYFIIYMAFKIVYESKCEGTCTGMYVFFVLVLMISAILLWGFSLYFFNSNVTSWKETPAMSRNLNERCVLFNYYDKHDIWHLLSAAALFVSFMTVLFADDNLQNVPRNDIHVF